MLWQESSSYRTFAATLDLAESVAPLWLILENVDLGDCSNADSNGATISRLLSEAGFVTRDYDNVWQHLYRALCIFSKLSVGHTSYNYFDL